jgi:hypothetical protein
MDFGSNPNPRLGFYRTKPISGENSWIRELIGSKLNAVWVERLDVEKTARVRSLSSVELRVGRRARFPTIRLRNEAKSEVETCCFGEVLTYKISFAPLWTTSETLTNFHPALSLYPDRLPRTARRLVDLQYEVGTRRRLAGPEEIRRSRTALAERLRGDEAARGRDPGAR